ncbi:DUF3575 domain-containing protein [Bacteroides sp. OttesenSCG-928-F21]|nr:DUF3575 domain-containing protein [Bacteroides sp. OttesenSCG-928-F21]
MKKIVLLLIGLYNLCTLQGQVLEVKTNLVSDALFSPNLAMEILLSNQFTLDLSAHYNPFKEGDTKRWKHWVAQPELRYWFCSPFTTGRFVGVHLLAGEYNLGGVHLPLLFNKHTRDDRSEGWFAGAGLSYGYHWILSPHWGIEAVMGLGFVRIKYDRYRCIHCGDRLGSGYRNWIGPTKMAVSLIYVLK